MPLLFPHTPLVNLLDLPQREKLNYMILGPCSGKTKVGIGRHFTYVTLPIVLVTLLGLTVDRLTQEFVF